MLLPLILWLLVLRFVMYLAWLVLYCYETHHELLRGKREEEPSVVEEEADPEEKNVDNKEEEEEFDENYNIN